MKFFLMKLNDLHAEISMFYFPLLKFGSSFLLSIRQTFD